MDELLNALKAEGSKQLGGIPAAVFHPIAEILQLQDIVQIAARESHSLGRRQKICVRDNTKERAFFDRGSELL